jgi:hypothetical protein
MVQDLKEFRHYNVLCLHSNIISLVSMNKQPRYSTHLKMDEHTKKSPTPFVPKTFKRILTGGHFGLDLPGIVFLRRQVVEAVGRGQPGLWPTLRQTRGT